MTTLIVVLGLLPGLSYSAVMVAGLGFGVLGPVRFLVERLLAPSWSELLFYALVLGGCTLSAALSLDLDERMTRRNNWGKVFGWIAVLYFSEYSDRLTPAQTQKLLTACTTKRVADSSTPCSEAEHPLNDSSQNPSGAGMLVG